MSLRASTYDAQRFGRLILSSRRALFNYLKTSRSQDSSLIMNRQPGSPPRPPPAYLSNLYLLSCFRVAPPSRTTVRIHIPSTCRRMLPAGPAVDLIDARCRLRLVTYLRPQTQGRASTRTASLLTEHRHPRCRLPGAVNCGRSSRHVHVVTQWRNTDVRAESC